MGAAPVTLGDVERAIATSDPQLGALLVRFLAQPDPAPGRDELFVPDADAPPVDVPAAAATFARLSGEVSARGLAGKTPHEKKLARRDAFAAAEASPFAPPRLRLGALLIALYEHGDEPGRAALLYAFVHGTMRWGVWQAAKTIYKRAEERHDAAMFGALAYRFDAMSTTSRAEIGEGTFVYLRRRAWRYLRLLGQASPDAYPTFAVEVLRHYPRGHTMYAASWVAAQIWAHGRLRAARGATFSPPTGGDALALRAFPAAWKLSPAPLLRLLESADSDLVCAWAIELLRGDHPLALRAVEPAWLARLGRRGLAAIDTFVVQLMRDSPELHQSKLRALGLHDTVIGFLRSPSPAARGYALEYAAAHAPDLAIDELLELIETGAPEVAKFAAARLEALAPAQLGMPALLRLLGVAATPWAAGKLTQAFAARDITAAAFVDTVTRSFAHLTALITLYNAQHAVIPAGHWTALLDDPRVQAGGGNHQVRHAAALAQTALTELGKRTAREIGVPWIQRALEDPARTGAIAAWLDAGMLSGDDVDLDWLRGLVAKPRLRAIALRLLGDRRRVAPARVGLGWLLGLARSGEADLATFAQRMLLESFEPADFGGVAKLWELATAPKQPEAVRAFAATYLKAHHPDLGPKLPEARALGIQPRLPYNAYALATLRPLFDDARADVRRLAVAIAREEIARWGDPDLLYQLAGSAQREPRALGSELLLGALEAETPARVPAAWLDGARLFALAESPHKAAREVALTLIRRLYDQVGGASRLAWLMDSPDRDVRLFAVRLLWDRHRPAPWPATWTPRKGRAPAAHERFGDLDALRQFVRVALFGLPPGRMPERDPVAEGAPRPERPLAASVAKRRLIETLRDAALDDVELARAIAPVLAEMTSSIAKGEWQASLQALTALRARHAELGAP